MQRYAQLLLTGAASLILAACSQLSDNSEPAVSTVTPENYRELNYIVAPPQVYTAQPEISELEEIAQEIRNCNKLIMSAQIGYAETTTKGGRSGPELQWPVSGRISEYFGASASRRVGTYHQGIDIDTVEIKPVVAAYKGTVAYLVHGNIGYGNRIIIDHGDFYTLYAHLSEFKEGLKRGSEVEHGQVIGKTGATGYATGVHLHFEVITKQSVLNDGQIKDFRKCIGYLEGLDVPDLNPLRNIVRMGLEETLLGSYIRTNPLNMLP